MTGVQTCALPIYPNSASPTDAPAWFGGFAAPNTNGQPVLAILDTGFDWNDWAQLIVEPIHNVNADADVVDLDADGVLDSQAGHGTFIAGIVRKIARTGRILAGRVLNQNGVCDEPDLARALGELSDGMAAGERLDVLSLSLSAYLADDTITPLLQASLGRLQAAGVIIVAAAGNDGSCRPTFPAAAPGVIGVGALGRETIAPFTNWGWWVRACAPGVDVISTFLRCDARVADERCCHRRVAFRGWARWSGTSFAAPRVAAEILRRIAAGTPAATVVTELIDDPGLATIPGLGTVVNVC